MNTCTVQHWRRAESTNFPLTVLSIVLNQHQAPRFVSHEGSTVPTRDPGSGFAAGDPLDTYLVQVYTTEPLDKWQAKHHNLPLSLFIEDFHAGITHAYPDVVTRELREGAESLSDLIKANWVARLRIANLSL